MPKSMGGSGGNGLNPEQLFAAGYAACFGSAVKHVASKAKKTIEAPVVSADVSIGTNDAGAFGLADQAHQVCPYSNATRGNVPVEIVTR